MIRPEDVFGSTRERQYPTFTQCTSTEETHIEKGSHILSLIVTTKRHKEPPERLKVVEVYSRRDLVKSVS